MAFVPLHVYSGFSYLHSGLVAERIPLLAKKRGYRSVALADEGSLSGFAPFTHACQKAGIQPLYGMDAHLGEGTFSLFVENEDGYHHLLKLTLLASQNALSLDLLKQNEGGLTVVLATESLLKGHEKDDLSTLAEQLSRLLKGFSHLYLGLPYAPQEKEFVSFVRSFAASHSYPLVAFPLISYEKKTDAIVTKITAAIQNHETLTEKEEEGFSYFLESDEVEKFFTKEEIAATEKIAQSLSSFVFIKERGSLLHYPNPLGISSEDYLKKLAYEGLAKRIPEAGKEYFERLDYELSVIFQMGYADYFLIVGDYVNFAKTHGVSVGPGRGSGAASLVAYSLNISAADPLKNDLLFERFLNPQRQSMPDIDVDFSDVNRDVVVRYLAEKYGKERVAHILTTQTIGAKEALRDIARVYGYEEREIELVISTIVDDKISLREDYKTSPQFKQLIDSDKYYLELVALASKIEGLPRQAGLHAAGIVLNDKPLPEVIPLLDEEGVGYVACLEKDYLEEQGFLKMDLLGLRNLSIIDECLALIKKSEGKTLTYDDIPYDDKEAIALIPQGRVMGLFQLESPGMKRAIREVEPSTFEEVAALLALFRPGPMQSIPSYARRKKGLERITYLSPELEPILKGTYGIIVYQEQIMQIVRAMAGFQYAQADLFRRAISKKDANKLAALKDTFIKGCLAKGHTEKLANEVYELIFKFADYGFNKAHAVSYAVLTCQMAFLKKRYPREFYCAILDSMSPGDSKFKDTISEIKDLSLHLEVPDINLSEKGFIVDKESLLFPLSAIKNLQGNFLDALLDERMVHGGFADIFDVAARLKKDGLTLPLLIRLIDAGALDKFGVNRAGLRASAPAAMSYADMMFGTTGQEALLDIGIEKPALVSAPTDLRSDLNAEYEALGFMVSGSPLSLFKEELEAKHIVPLSKIGETQGSFVTAGIVKNVRAIVTRKGSQMAFLEIYDEVTEASFVLFSESYAASYAALKEDAIVLVTARKDLRKDDSYLADKVERLGA
jgi:DNA polymerase-3 subunit alpha